MRRLLAFVFFVSVSLVAFSQSKKDKVTPAGVISSVSASSAGQGKVTISQDPKMAVLLKKQLQESEEDLYIFYTGYRVQVYMSNGQKKAKEEAYAREKQMKEKMPDLPYYVSFSSPFWKLRVGDYRTYTEALVAANTIKKEFPEFSTDVLVVKDEETRDLTFEQAEKRR